MVCPQGVYVCTPGLCFAHNSPGARQGRVSPGWTLTAVALQQAVCVCGVVAPVGFKADSRLGSVVQLGADVQGVSLQGAECSGSGGVPRSCHTPLAQLLQRGGLSGCVAD